MRSEEQQQLAFLDEQNRLLKTIAAGADCDAVLLELTRAVARLQPGLRSCILMANEDRTAVAESATADFPREFGEAIAGAPINEIPFGTCGVAMHSSRPVGCSDIATASEWAPQWRALCLAHGIRAGHSTPIFVDGVATASFFMCFHEPRDPADWELRLAGMSAQIAGIALERERARQTAEAVRRSEARLQRAVAELQEVDRRKNSFLATLAHELRNPLAPVRAGLDVLRLAPPGSETATEAREMMERQVDHLVRLVDDLLDISRITSGKVELRMRPTRLQDFARDAVEASRPLVAARRHALSVELPAQEVWLEGDPMRLAQIVSNLLLNAAKFTPMGGRIALKAAVAGERVVIEVHDNGVGIAPGALEAVFDMFTQLHDGHSPPGGLGIGLSLVRNLAGLHRGRVEAFSRGEGQGSVFRLELPLAAAPPAATLPRTAPANGPRRRILIVDDNVDAARMLAAVLTLRGHDVRCADTGAAGLATAREFRPELALLDIGLPDLDGHSLARALRADPQMRDTVLAAHTGWGTEADVARSRDAGFAHHLIKPASAGTIEGLLAQLPQRS
jgi:signal transduction histidine kinase/CheY-like chemotaxis protein